MLKHMVGLLRADAGEIRIEGRDVTRLSESDWVEVRKRIAYVFQGAALFDSLSVFENIAYGLREHLPLGESQIAARVAECLHAVGLEGVEERMPSELSGGMRKRVGVARGIALEPEAILYDEPTTGLDPANSRRIGQLIAELRQRLDVTSVIVTHDLSLCFAISDRVGLLGAGRLIAVGTPAEIQASDIPEVREFLAGDLDAHKDLWSGPARGVAEAARVDEE
jgi:phospholipid/cholesterol/gamma-HCH transport system ATP-binding protein